MAKYKETILTNMVMAYRDNGEFLVEERTKNDWPGINFPGGHVEDDEGIEESGIREMKEETGLSVSGLECVGYYEWNQIEEGRRHLAILFRTKSVSGSLVSSDEGKVYWTTRKGLDGKTISNDFLPILEIMVKGTNI